MIKEESKVNIRILIVYLPTQESYVVISAKVISLTTLTLSITFQANLDLEPDVHGLVNVVSLTPWIFRDQDKPFIVPEVSARMISFQRFISKFAGTTK